MRPTNIKRRSGFKRWGFGIAIATSAVLLLVSYLIWHIAAPMNKGSATLKSFTISSGQSVKQVSAALYEGELIRSRFWFEVWVWFTDTETSFGAGDYRLPTRASVANLVTLLTGGATPTDEVSLRFIEGWTASEMGQYLQIEKFSAAVEFKALASATNASKTVSLVSPDLAQGMPGGATLEGYLFPDTYRVYKSAEADDLISKMIVNLDAKFQPSWRVEVRRRGYSAHQVLTMASIIEREVRTDNDRALVSDIFWRRFEASRGLEADSTINYVTGKGLAAVTLDDTKLDSPYNTYRYRGLPPGPISNPGEASIRAAVYPKPNDFWYFLTPPDGSVVYSRTFEEHKQAKARYLR